MEESQEVVWGCPEPFRNILYLRGEATPCCVVRDWDTMSLEEYQTSEKVAAFRKEFETPGLGELQKKHCSVCLKQETIGQLSHRQIKLRSSKYFNHTLEYQSPDNWCNLRCLMCDGGNSSSIANENYKIGLGPKRRRPPQHTDMSMFDDVLRNIDYLKITGGESLGLRDTYLLMQRAIDLGVSQDMTLAILTNGTMVPKFNGQDVFEYGRHFRDLRLSISIEVFGNENDYIRYPSKFSKILSNVERAIEKTQISKERRLSLQFIGTYMSLNVGSFAKSYLEFERWVSDKPGFVPGDKAREGRGMSFVSVNVSNPYQISAIPHDIRDLYLDRIYSRKGRMYNSERQSLNSLSSWLENEPFDEPMFNEMMTDVRARDAHRGVKLTDYFPEWEPYY